MGKTIFNRVLSWLLMMLILLSIMSSLSVLAVTPDASEQFKYTINGGAATITGYAGTETEIIIPDELGGYPVKSIGEEAFSWCDSLKKVTIPDGVTDIGRGAFTYSENLESVIFPKSIKSIGDDAFEFCKSLKDVTIPRRVTSIGSFAFGWCESLESIKIPSSVVSIGYRPFSGCSNLESIVVDTGNTVYDSRDNCNAIIETKTNTLISGCADTVIPDGVTSIGDYAFAWNNSLKNIVVPKGVTSIGEGAFSFCKSFEVVKIPEGVTEVGEEAFYGCKSLTGIKIPGSVTCIGDKAISNCESLITIVVDKNNSVYDSRDNCNAIIETKTNTLLAGCAKTTIPSSIVNIGNGAFAECPSVARIEIPEGVQIIGERAFAECTGLEVIVIPKSVTSIGYDSFLYCEDLLEVHYGSTQRKWETISAGQIFYLAIFFFNESDDDGMVTLLGDANADLKVNVKDATAIQKAVAGILSLTDAGNRVADVDSNDKVNVKDATVIQKWVAGIETGFKIGE